MSELEELKEEVSALCQNLKDRIDSKDSWIICTDSDRARFALLPALLVLKTIGECVTFTLPWRRWKGDVRSVSFAVIGKREVPYTEIDRQLKAYNVGQDTDGGRRDLIILSDDPMECAALITSVVENKWRTAFDHDFN